MQGVYKITCKPTGDIYIGSSINIHCRWVRHKWEIRTGRKQGLFLTLSSKYGVDSFFFEVIEICDVKDLLEREQYYIDLLLPTLNISKIAGSPNNVGEHNTHKAKYSREQYMDIVLYKIENPSTSIKELSRYLGISYSICQQILSGDRHTWIREAIPKEYDQVVRKKRKATIYLKHNKYGTVLVENRVEFCRDYGLAPSNLCNLINGKINSYCGWTLCDSFS